LVEEDDDQEESGSEKVKLLYIVNKKIYLSFNKRTIRRRRMKKEIHRIKEESSTPARFLAATEQLAPFSDADSVMCCVCIVWSKIIVVMNV